MHLHRPFHRRTSTSSVCPATAKQENGRFPLPVPLISNSLQKGIQGSTRTTQLMPCGPCAVNTCHARLLSQRMNPAGGCDFDHQPPFSPGTPTRGLAGGVLSHQCSQSVTIRESTRTAQLQPRCPCAMNGGQTQDHGDLRA